jgi:hypothetical protein
MRKKAEIEILDFEEAQKQVLINTYYRNVYKWPEEGKEKKTKPQITTEIFRSCKLKEKNNQETIN